MGAVTMPDFGHYRRRLLLAMIFRFDLVVPYALPLLLCSAMMALAAGRKSWRKSLILPPALPGGLICLTAMLLAAVVTAFCNNQLASTFRLYMFCLYPVLMITGILFALAQQASSVKLWLEKATAMGMALIALFALMYPMHQFSNRQKWHWIDFALGRTTIAQVYAEHDFLWKPGITACEQVPADTRIWSFQIIRQLFESPHCRFETFISNAMGRDFAVINFDDADKAEAALRRQNLDYFLIDTSSPLFDILPYSPLFSPEQIGRHLGVVWSQGGVYLLTWHSPQTTPLPPEFFEGYRKSLKITLFFADFAALHHAVGGYYLDWKRNPHWPIVVDPHAPRPKGWQ
jgi:hypothetical protein